LEDLPAEEFESEKEFIKKTYENFQKFAPSIKVKPISITVHSNSNHSDDELNAENLSSNSKSDTFEESQYSYSKSPSKRNTLIDITNTVEKQMVKMAKK
jgi:hypothetical protein